MKWILYDTKCPSNAYTLKLKNIKSIFNPYKLQCNKAKCKKNVNIRKNTIFEFLSHKPMSILINAIKLFICEEKNATKTIKTLNKPYQLSSLGVNTIHKLFSLLRKYMAQYYFTVYNYEKLAYNNEYKTIAIDESLFVHDHNGLQEWVIE